MPIANAAEVGRSRCNRSHPLRSRISPYPITIRVSCPIRLTDDRHRETEPVSGHVRRQHSGLTANVTLCSPQCTKRIEDIVNGGLATWYGGTDVVEGATKVLADQGSPLLAPPARLLTKWHRLTAVPQAERDLWMDLATDLCEGGFLAQQQIDSADFWQNPKGLFAQSLAMCCPGAFRGLFPCLGREGGTHGSGEDAARSDPSEQLSRSRFALTRARVR